MSQLGSVKVELSVVLGQSAMPISQFLRMGGGAVIPLHCQEEEPVWILANGHPIARGEIVIQGDRVTVAILGPADANDFVPKAA